MQSNQTKPFYRCFISLLLSYVLLVSSVPLATTASANLEGKESSKTGAPSTPSFQQQNAARHRSGELLVRFRAGSSEHDKLGAIASLGAHRKRQLRGESGIEKLELAAGQNPETAAQRLRLNPAIELAEPNFLINHDELRGPSVFPEPTRQTPRPLFDLKSFNPELAFSNHGMAAIPGMATIPQLPGIQPNDPRFVEQWALNNTGQSGGQFGSDIGVTGAWQRTTGGASTVIAVIDSGIDFTHPDLANNKWTNRAPGPDGDTNGWDYITDSGTIVDEQGHGTAIAGIIAAQGNNMIGVAGVMWQASLMSLRVLDNTGTGDIANAVEAIDYAAGHGAQVINISWGTTGESLALKDAIERATRRGVVVVCSAGNNGQNLDQTPYYPASFNIRDLISVAATDNFDQLASWSNWGRRQVTVAAPGVNLLTTQRGGGYWLVTGTSASAPLVSGIAGLIKTERPWSSVAATRQAIIDGVRQVSGLAGKVSSDGVVNASGALGSLRGPNGQSGGNGNGQGGVSPRPPDTGRNDGTHGRRVAPPSSVSDSNQGYPNLDEIRNRPSHFSDSEPAPIHSNLAPICDTCFEADATYPSDPEFSTARSAPENETGESGVDLGSRNFNWGTPLVSLPGRAGLDLNIALYYNSLVWTKQDTSVQFNADNGYPSPGFHLGFPTVQERYFDSEVGTNAYMMITSTGGRVRLVQVGTTNVYESIDSAYTQLIDNGTAGALVRTTDGTQYNFQNMASGEKRCNQIKDRNGNFITIAYNGAGRISSVTDTLARVINFLYDGEGNLSQLTQSRASSGHHDLLAEFFYGVLSVQPAFDSSLTVFGPVGQNISVLTQVRFVDGIRYHFDYTSWGQVFKIRSHAPDGHPLAYTGYNLPGSEWLASSTQTDCPRFTQRRDWIEYGVMQQNAEVITSYAVAGDSSWTQVTLPDDTPTNPNDNVVHKEYFATSGWQKGLTTRTEVFLAGSPSVLKKWTTIAWTQDDVNLSYQKNPRPLDINAYDEANNRRRTTFEYHPTYAVFGLPWIILEYANDGVTVLRRTYLDYKMDAAYIERRIIGLLYQKQIFDGAWSLYSRVIFGYDWAGELFVDTPAAATQHDRTNYGPSFVTGRGNLQHIIRMDATDPDNSNKWTETKFRLNTTGSMLMVRDHDWHENALSYGDSFSDGVNRNTFAYPTTFTDAAGYQTTTKYNYATGAVTERRRPSSGTSGQGNVTYETVTISYDWSARLQTITNQNNGFYTRFVYPASLDYVESYRNVKPGSSEDYSIEVFDGLGRMRKVARFMPEKTDRYSAQMIHYNSLGQVVKQSKPTEILGGWTPTGDDSSGWVYTDQAYDWQGRPTVTTNPDGWTSELSYTGCGCAGGEVVTARDEAGRRRKLYKDVLDRLNKVEELNWDQTVYSTTTYAYNVRDQLTQISQQGQVRTLEYDGHGRLWKRATPEQGLTEYSYNRDDTLAWAKDARGAKTNFAYTARHLVSSISFDLSGVLAGQNVAATSGVTFGYDAAGNRTQMTDGLGTVTYHYDSMSRMDWEERNFTGVGTYRLTYGYNNAGLASITNPWGSQVSYTHDHTGTVTAVTGSGAVSASTYASGMQYRAFGALKAMSYGNTRQLAVSYDSRMRPVQWDVLGLFGSEYRYDYFHEHTNRVTFVRHLYTSTLDRSYEYDQVGRLNWAYTGAEASAHAFSGQWGTQDGPYAQANFYDQFGNITQRLGWGAANPSFTASYTNNRKNGLSYDLAGNLTNDGQAFTYDATSQQVSASYSGYALTQGYDGDTLRVKKTENGTTTYYLRSSVLSGQVVAEIAYLGGSWTWLRGYVQVGGQLLAVQQDGAVRWVHEDPITKSKAMTDATGATISWIVFDPWGGTTWNQNVSQQRRRFTTYERDGNESDEAMFRRYNRWWSRFDQPDPYDGAYDFSDPQSFNRYAYVQNDPVNFVDPSGLDEWDANPGFIPAWMNGWDRTINPTETFINYSQDRTAAWHDFWGNTGEYPWFFGGFPPFSFGPQNPQRPSLPDAIKLAKKLLADPKGPCAELFKKGNGLSTLNKLDKKNKIKIADTKVKLFGGPERLLSSMPGVGAVITKKGIFINPAGRIAQGNPSPTGPFGKLTPLEAMAGTIIHETAHKTGDFPKEANETESTLHSADVVDACFQGRRP